MKKRVVTILASSILTSGLLAGSLSNGGVGASSTEFNNEDAKGGFYLMIDIMKVPKELKGFGYGIGFDANVFGTQSDGIARGDGAYTMGALAKVGYTFEDSFDIPLKIKAGYGYGVTRTRDENGWGIQYDAAVEYTIYNRYGLGVKYKHVEAGFDNVDVDVDATLFYITSSF